MFYIFCQEGIKAERLFLKIKVIFFVIFAKIIPQYD